MHHQTRALTPVFTHGHKEKFIWGIKLPGYLSDGGEQWAGGKDLSILRGRAAAGGQGQAEQTGT